MNGRLCIDRIFPVVDGGRHPAKAVTGEPLPVAATVWREGHGAVGAAVVWTGPAPASRTTVPMTRDPEDEDRWHAEVTADRPGAWTFRIEAWSDPWADWRAAVTAKVADGQGADELRNDLETGARLLDRAARRPNPERRRVLVAAAATLRAEGLLLTERLAPALGDDVRRILADAPLRDLLTRSRRHRVWADRSRALFGSWYEMFPRSTGGVDASGRPVHGTFATAAEDLPRIAAMGFDVVYLPPVHPIGETHRKGRNNALVAEPGDVGSPWAVGSALGGHDALHPDLGTFHDFARFVGRARELGMEVALDLAFQCAPDHPWVREHPEWFVTRPDGTIAYAENPPKRYQDIHPLSFDRDPEGLSEELLRIVLFWIGHGVRVFRVDNPHTKPPVFWQWLIEQVRRHHPDVLFLAEAFTRPVVLEGLAKLGFSQSYTYFTWRTEKGELEDYLTELAGSTHFLRPNFFVNTPDILHRSLQIGGPNMFAIRAALAATMSPTWGVYSGFELYEDKPLEDDGEEYLDSEKYQLRPRDHARARAAGRSLEPLLTRLNEIRRDHPALQQLRSVRVHKVDNDALTAFSKTDPVTGDAVLCVVTLDPFAAEEGTVWLDPADLGLAPAGGVVREELTGERVELGVANPVKFEPWNGVVRIFAVERS
ncbi:alpha-1,4-glucan--maltose-1-phosphate maltosyltransferase [Actinomadura oligospora]|uniref:alpha-1,4-glucan--maltose-1-phosphate maltosyltransferase n=1 Tax=Actinomadura oligospora TaxID=111804 RepID=UPI00047ADA20|nr:alpha-1,4-glucan--maltose-1-phosphate maltosyltransferase [Actinomadura oligospora]